MAFSGVRLLTVRVTLKRSSDRLLRLIVYDRGACAGAIEGSSAARSNSGKTRGIGVILSSKNRNLCRSPQRYGERRDTQRKPTDTKKLEMPALQQTGPGPGRFHV